jgi:hypothetical protein
VNNGLKGCGREQPWPNLRKANYPGGDIKPWKASLNSGFNCQSFVSEVRFVVIVLKLSCKVFTGF